MDSNSLRNYQCEPDPKGLATQPGTSNAAYFWPQQDTSRRLSVPENTYSAVFDRNLSSPAGQDRLFQPRRSIPHLPDNTIDPGLEKHHSPFGYSSNASSNSLPKALPLERFYHESEGPWNTLMNLTVPGQPSSLGPAPNLTFPGYRSRPNSEIASHDTGLVADDSGYVTVEGATQSVPSMDYSETHQDYSGLHHQVESIQFAPAPSPGPSEALVSNSKSPLKPLKFQTTSSVTRKKEPDKCPQCGWEPKCPSDLRKHLLKHTKPFRCNVPGCKRTVGFTTTNDLKRHEKSVHKIGTGERSFKCASVHCRKRDKLWPRLDNFKQHVARMHPGEDVDEFIKRSQWDGEPLQPHTPQLSVPDALDDTTLAGMDDPTRHDHKVVFPSPAFWPHTGLATPQSLGVENGHHQAGLMAFDGNTTGPGGGRPLRSDTVSTDSSSRLSTLAEAACGSGVVNRGDPDSATSPPEHGTSQYMPAPMRQQTRASEDEERVMNTLGVLSNVIARGISLRSPKDGPLNSTILRVLSSMTGLSSLPNGTRESSPHSFNYSAQEVNDDDDLNEDINEATEQSVSVTAKADLVKGFAEIAALLTKRGKKNHAARSRRTSSSQTKSKACSMCNQSFDRNCQLRKHMKRHERPYGCTFPRCNKTSGSKSDWKRHENSQHFQRETWRCQLPKYAQSQQEPVSTHNDDPSVHCGELFYDAESFRNHLHGNHRLEATEKVEYEVSKRRIGNNGQVRFWCGFCGDVVDLAKRQQEAWDERFNHIDVHFNKGKRASDWWCMEEKMRKGDSQRMMKRMAFGGNGGYADKERTNKPESWHVAEQVMIHEASSTEEDSVRSPDHPETRYGPDHGQGYPTPGETTSSSLPPPPSSSSYSNPRKRRRGRENSSRQKKRSNDIMRYCCQCEHGPWVHKVFGACVACNHQFCDRCRKVDLDQEENQDLDAELGGF